jgi:hypothetical protein
MNLVVRAATDDDIEQVTELNRDGNGEQTAIHLRPVLSARLSKSSFGHESGEAHLSLYRSMVHVAYQHGVSHKGCTPFED